MGRGTWTDQYWYCYWSEFSGGIKGRQIFKIVGGRYFTYDGILSDIDGCLETAAKDNKCNNPVLIEKLRKYMSEFIDYINLEFGPERCEKIELLKKNIQIGTKLLRHNSNSYKLWIINGTYCFDFFGGGHISCDTDGGQCGKTVFSIRELDRMICENKLEFYKNGLERAISIARKK